MIFFLGNMIAKDQSALIRPISIALGYIMDFFFNMAFFVTEPHSLGISIILLTIATRFLMLPLAFNSQKSMAAMKKLQPEIDKIKKKYGDNKDPEIQQKMNREIQSLYSKNKVNPFGGCLPLLIQMPIFFALSYMMQQSYLYVRQLGDIYNTLAEIILSIPDRYNYLLPIVYEKIPKGMELDLSSQIDLVKALNKFTQQDWQNFLYKTPSELGIQRFGQQEWRSLNAVISEKFVSGIEPILKRKKDIEFFFGINLKEFSGTRFPGIIIPLLSAGTTFLSSWIMNKQQPPAEGQAKTTQMAMTYGMPIFIGFTTINFPAGVGIYWITSTVFQVFQQMFLGKYYDKKDENLKNEIKS